MIEGFGGPGAGLAAYCALARVDADEDGAALIEVVSAPDENGVDQILGVKVDCTIVEGPFVGARVAAKMCAPLGASTPTPPEPGQVIMIMMPNGAPDLGCYAVAVVPGGAGTPMKKAIAGVDVSNPESLKKMRVDAPPKGVGKVDYLRGAPYGIRLKGKSDAFSSELFIGADDGTSIVVRWNPATQSYGVKVNDSKGAFLQVCDGEISAQSPNAQNGVYITDEGVRVVATKFEVNASGHVTMDGAFIGLALGGVPPVLGMNAIGGAAGTLVPAAPAPAVGYIAPRVFLGGA